MMVMMMICGLGVDGNHGEKIDFKARKYQASNHGDSLTSE